MRAVLVTTLAAAVALHIDSALANQKRKGQDANGQYDNLATEACNYVECSPSFYSTNPSQFAKCCPDYGAGERFSGGVLVLPRGGGGGGGRERRGRGGSGKLTHDRRWSLSCGLLSSCLPLNAPPSKPPPPASQPLPPASQPLPQHQPPPSQQMPSGSHPHPQPPLSPSQPLPPVYHPSLRPPLPVRYSPSLSPHASPLDPARAAIRDLRRFLDTLPQNEKLLYASGLSGLPLSHSGPNNIQKFYYSLGLQHAGGQPVPSLVERTFLFNLAYRLGYEHSPAYQEYFNYYDNLLRITDTDALVSHLNEDDNKPKPPKPPSPLPPSHSPSSVFYSPQPVANSPQPVANSPQPALHASPYDSAKKALRALFRFWPTLRREAKYYYSIGFYKQANKPLPPELVGPAMALLNKKTLPIHFIYSLGRQHAGGQRVSKMVERPYLFKLSYNIGYVHALYKHPPSPPMAELNKFDSLLRIVKLDDLTRQANELMSQAGGQGQVGRHDPQLQVLPQPHYSPPTP